MKNFKKLLVWQKGIDLVVEVYKLTGELPSREKFILSQQLCKAAVSIPSNIAEGSAKYTKAHYKLYLENALGSAYEVETQLLIIQKIYPQFEVQNYKCNDFVIEIQKMLISFINSL
jgi:four helix bundle protein